MPRHRPYDRDLEKAVCYSQVYRGYEIVAHLTRFGDLTVVVYSDELSELVHRTSNVMCARAWIDRKTQDRADLD